MRVTQAVSLVQQYGCVCTLTLGPGGAFTVKHPVTGFEKSLPLATFEKMDERRFVASFQHICSTDQA